MKLLITDNVLFAPYFLKEKPDVFVFSEEIEKYYLDNNLSTSRGNLITLFSYLQDASNIEEVYVSLMDDIKTINVINLLTYFKKSKVLVMYISTTTLRLLQSINNYNYVSYSSLLEKYLSKDETNQLN